jgi:hypothetical protein
VERFDFTVNGEDFAALGNVLVDEDFQDSKDNALPV